MKMSKPVFQLGLNSVMKEIQFIRQLFKYGQLIFI